MRLCYIYFLVLVPGVFPDDFKIAKVTPIYKDGDKYESKNYCPIPFYQLFPKSWKNLFITN